MIEENLEILIITYNRAKDLENTFKQLMESPFSNCKITVLDNCSTDKTPEICTKYQQIFENMHVVRHKKNIGANPNYLRAVEKSEAIYTWVLCDDDIFDFSECDDVLGEIESNTPDIIIVTSHYQYGWEKGLKTTSNELIRKGSRYYHTLSFMPAIIFKTELFDSNCIHKGYFNVSNLYPHFEFINKSVEEDFKVYVSKKGIVEPGGFNQRIHFSVIHWLVVWMNSCLTIKNKYIRKRTIYDSPLDGGSFLLFVIIWIIMEKKSKNKDNKDFIRFISAFIIAFGLNWYIFALVLIIPFMIIPSIFYKFFLKSFAYFKYHVLKKERPHKTDLQIDEFRY
ncbi:MAG: glycosyltransferase [Methanobacterium sp.]|uniref:glycosyltransferase family 2 protein n=1 Tax=Methanobacterium sp. TaxID=2164 RepID=UPI003D64E0A3|nr:glycosyltransferase [Methanobacterium sp.]